MAPKCDFSLKMELVFSFHVALYVNLYEEANKSGRVREFYFFVI